MTWMKTFSSTDPAEKMPRKKRKQMGGARKRVFPLLMFVVLLAALWTPAVSRGQGAEKIVRVGWYDSSFNTMDASRRRSGYAYEYQMKIAAYTGWKYEYINGSWSQLMQMLDEGEIDLMSDVSYTEERAERMLFPSLPMGTEEYYIFVTPGNAEISSSDYSTLGGKRIGVNRGSVQAGFYQDWAARHGVEAELIEVTGSEEDSLRMLEEGELDAYVTVDSFSQPERVTPVCKVGSSDFYFAVSRARADLLTELETALARIQEENPEYDHELAEKHLVTSGANTIPTPGEQVWLAGHGAIRVGYLDNYLAFCATDPETGELTGALKDYLAYASECLQNVRIDFEPVAYPTVAAAIEGLRSGEVDCVFPLNLSAGDGEPLDVFITAPLMRSAVFAIVRETKQAFFAGREHVVVAVNEGNLNYDSFLTDHFPGWRSVYYPNADACLRAVEEGVADCYLISNYRYSNLARFCEKNHLTPFDTGVELEFGFAVAAGETELYSILSRIISRTPGATVTAALSAYMVKDAKTTLADFVVDHLGVIMAVIGAVLLVILALMIRSMRAERKAGGLISATETDEMTGLYSRNFFFQYANRMNRESPETPRDAIVLNIDRFHSVNELHGRAFGDRVLRLLGAEVRAIAKENGGIAGRFEADRFDIWCRPIADYRAVYARLQERLDTLSPNASVRLRMGVMPWQAGLEPVLLFDRARTACGMARAAWTEHLVIFDEQAQEREMLEQRLLNDLRRGLDSYEFEVYYQPQYDIRSDPPKPVAAEALVRWNHPELGMIAPADFIPLFEQSGKIGELDRYVWTEAARQVTKWQELYGVSLPVSVNLSRLDVFDPELESTLDRILRFNGLERHMLKLEVTESAYTENADQVIEVVKRLRGKGYEVEMDDFGSGYSSLNMLSAMPVDILKMDRAFVLSVERDEKNVQLVAVILGLAKTLKIPVVAEGVETPSQLKMLRDLGCELVQGYVLCRPLPPAEFEEKIILKLQEA